MGDNEADILSGLSSEEARKRLLDDGYNELPSQRKKRNADILLGVLREPMFLLLIACGSLYLVSGEIGEALMLLGFVFVIIGITFYQERKTERALEALRDLSSPRALVIRGGRQRYVAGREVVRGDIVLLSEGTRVPADCVLLRSVNLSVDESLLTGESVPVRKVAAEIPDPTPLRPGGDDLPFVYSGSLVVRGQAVGLVKATGERTELGRIGKALERIPHERTPLQNQTAEMVRKFGVSGFAVCALVVLVYWLTRGDLLTGFLAGLALAMAMLPEEFPVVLTVFLALGAWRLSQNRVLTRRVPAVETLGAATVLCVDKTGTLTVNRMTVTDIVTETHAYEVPARCTAMPEAFHEVVEYSVLASPADPFDPMEKAVKDLAERTLVRTEHLHSSWTLRREYPLRKELLAMSRVWTSTTDNRLVIAAKGAPEAIADLCHFDKQRCESLDQRIAALASRGRRVIGVARAHHDSPRLPGGQHDFGFEFVGLLGLEDPIRPYVKDAIGECYGAGVRTIMITGDYGGTATSIAGQIGLKKPRDIITGQELESLTDDQVASRIRETNIFARMVPEQKLRIVDALKHNGEIVAMTGDGVNDAPALKAAHIGIAMGARGTDVAREAASLVLLDDDFNAIVAAVRMGRRIYDNLKKAMIYIVSVHIPIAGLSLIPVLLKWPLILFPVHIVLLELIIDPACTLVFEADEDDRDVMKRRPRGVGEKLLDRTALLRCAVQGSATLAVTLGIYWFIRKDHPAGTARALAFLTLVVCNIGMILSNRSLTRSLFAMLRVDNAALTWVITGTTAVLCLILAFPGMRQLFRFGPVSLYDVLTAFGGGIAAVAVMELLKWAIPACAECSRNPWDARRRRLGETESSSKARR